MKVVFQHPYTVRKSRKIPIEIALILLLLAPFSVGADVKLRIYLQDGTLQAGNLVAENPDSFVILSKEGRVELKKDKIMFINGKTLKQWEERPDKFFQTEIIPSEIPNPSYVHDKAAIPTLPPPVTPAPQNTAAKSAAAATSAPVAAPVRPLAEVTKTEAVKPAEPVKKAEPVKPPEPVKQIEAAKPVAVAKAAEPVVKKQEARQPRAKRSKKRAPVETAAATPPVKPAPTLRPSEVLTAEANIPRPSRFVRKDFGDYHYQRALRYQAAGERGRAVQELHYATTLDRQNGESVFLLGKLYKEEGEFAKARKYFAHPLVRKREEVKTWADEMIQAEKDHKRSRQIFYGIAGVGVFAWIPLLFGWRYMKGPAKRILTTEQVEELTSVDELSTPEPAFTGFKQAPPKPMAPIPPTPPIAPVIPPAPVAPPMPAFNKPEIPKPIEPVVPPTPAAPPQRIFDPIVPPVAPPMPPPIVVPMLSGLLPEEPVAPGPVPRSSPLASEGGDVQSVLRLASMVDRAVRNGNALAVEEKFDLARREYRTALALNPGCVEAYIGLGYLCFSQGQWDLALEHYTKALGIAPASADAHYGIGRVFLEIERVDEAIYEFQQTLKLDATFEDARETLTTLGAAV